ncbi:CHAT domain-containing protein [Spongiibacter sp. KMU-158]|uniref:CHAT domain-containing protein n=1 Tax=Spongiibacter pelagi TaxID=2760804 RepID=A0A927GX42_9GAMM|nr:CHAT domain-containing protein [Spongiibacter pelagi]MBD2859607.1 CHAT domain-containing protein [Spongiibacter pelagi]
MRQLAHFKRIFTAAHRLLRSRSLVFIAAILLSGCAASPYDENKFYTRDYNLKFQSNLDVFSSSSMPIAQFAQGYPGQTYYICRAHNKLRNFSQFLTCRDQFMSVTQSELKDYVFRRDAINIMYGEYLIAIGRYAEAYDLLFDIYQRNIENGASLAGNLLGAFTANWGELGAQNVNAFEAIMPVLVAAKLSGKHKEFDNALLLSKNLEAKIRRNQRWAAGMSDVNMQMKTLLARLAVAQNDYEKAYEEITRGYQFGIGSIVQAAGMLTGGTLLYEATGEYDNERFNVANLSAYSAFKTGRNSIAKEQYLELLKSPIFNQQKNFNFHVYHHLGLISQQEGDIESAINYFEQAVDALESARSTINTEAAKIGFVGDKQAVYRDLVSALVTSGQAARAFEYAERGKARALVDLLASKKSFAGRNSAEVNQALAELDQLQLASLESAPVDAGAVGAEKRGLKRIQQTLQQEAPEVASLVSVSTENPSEIQQLLRNDEAIIEYFYHSPERGEAEQLFAFVVTPGQIQAVSLNAKGLDGEVRELRQAIANSEGEAWQDGALALYQRLIEPLSKSLTGKTHLTIVPHGALHYLPFNVLRAANNQFLIEQHTVRMLPSASVMKFLNKGTAPSQNLLVLGNPDLNDSALDLPGAQEEARAISALWPDSKVVLRQFASETVIKNSASAFKYLHLASHGQFDSQNPLNSRMLLSADSENDGYLTVPEIYDLQLNADMVVLSACQTALGDVTNGDDVVGLNRGFLYAGAKAIVGSLWEVPDEPTKDLMISLYQNLNSMDIRSAMQAAQIAAIKKYPHPVSWAAFQLTGGD